MNRFRNIPFSRLRHYASVSKTSNITNPYTVGPFQVFDRNAKRLQRDRAAQSESSRTVDYVRDAVAERLVERLYVGFTTIVCLYVCLLLP